MISSLTFLSHLAFALAQLLQAIGVLPSMSILLDVNDFEQRSESRFSRRMKEDVENVGWHRQGI